MDRDTLLAHRGQWGEEPLDGRRIQDLAALTEAMQTYLSADVKRYARHICRISSG
jgi:hypothetical protein